MARDESISPVISFYPDHYPAATDNREGNFNVIATFCGQIVIREICARVHNTAITKNRPERMSHVILRQNHRL